MTSKDTEFLKKRIVQSTQPKEATVTTSGVTAVDETSQFLEDVTADSPDVQSVMQKKLHKRALLADAHDAQKAARLQEQQEKDAAQRELDEREERERTQARAIRDVTTRTISGVADQTGAIADKVGTFPTYGGIGMLIAILIILLFTVVRVNEQGDTRLKQLWYMLNGRATIKGRQTVEASIPGTGNTIIPGGGVSGNFGTPPATGGG